MSEKVKYLTIDGRNGIYRAVYAGLADGLPESKLPAVFFRFLSFYLTLVNNCSRLRTGSQLAVTNTLCR